MIDALNYAVRYAVKLGPHLKQIEENKERVYQLSRHLPEKEGYELIKIFDNTLEESKKFFEKSKDVKHDREDD